MAFVIRWTKRADITFAKIVSYLEKEWTEKEVGNFVKKTFIVINLISHNPEMFPATKGKDVRKGLISKQNSLIYRIKKKEIELLFFWDNRQNPRRFNYK